MDAIQLQVLESNSAFEFKTGAFLHRVVQCRVFEYPPNESARRRAEARRYPSASLKRTLPTYATVSSSTSKIRVAFGGILPSGVPLGP